MSELDRLIRKTRSLLRSSWVATGLGLTVGLAVGTLAAVTLTDLVLPLWPTLRLTALLLVVVPAAWAFFTGVVRPLFRRLRPVQVARRIETHIPGIHNRLVSCIDLAENNQPAAYSPAFYRRLFTEALERIRGFRARTVIDFLSLRRAGAFAFASVTAFAVAFLLFSDRLPTAVARIFHPFADIPPASGVHFTVTPAGDAKVLRGEDITFTVEVQHGEAKEFQIELTADRADKPLWHALKKLDGNHWQIALNSSNLGAGFEHAFHYRVHGGGTWTRLHQVQVLDRPAITSLHTVLHFPEYMGIAEPRVGPAQTADVTGPEESQVEVVVQAEGDVKEGEVQFLEPRTGRIDPAKQVERAWFEDKIPAGAVAEGTWLWDKQKHQRPAHTEPAAVGTHGHWFSGASVAFQVQPGDHLFAYVYLDPAKPPDAVMLEWHDGRGWEHRAFWGVDTIQLGKANSPGRWRMGPLPPAGQWVRLEVPAEVVGLAGQSLRGMSFKLSGGQCYWARAGAVRVEEQVLAPTANFAMHATADSQWSGRFPLRGTGLYRVELRNELGYANKPMKEGRYVAIPDNPPQIVLERPGADLVLSVPGKVPLVIGAYDDFGLADVSLALQRGDGAPWENQVVRRYDKPRQNDSIVTNLDLAALGLKTGGMIRYHAEARDRKGQVARTADFVVRVAADLAAADKQLAAFEKTQDPFRQKLVNLIAQQAKVRDQVEKLAAKYVPLNDKIKEAESRVKPKEVKTNPAKPQQAETQPKVPKVDPETQKMLDELRKELAELGKQENQNLELGRQVERDLAQVVDQANKLQMLPRDIAQQIQALQQVFQQRALNPLQNLAGAMNRGANPREAAPDLKEMQQTSDRLQRELEAMKDRLKALDDAEKKAASDPDEAIAKLKEEMLKQQGGLTARDLEDLKNFIAALRDELNKQKGAQEGLEKDTAKADSSDLSELEKKQGDLDKKVDDALGKTKDLQASEKMQRMKRRPSFPKSPYDPDAGEKTVPPKEEDPDDPDAAAKDKGDPKAGAEAKDKKQTDDEKEEMFMPALGGPKPKVDPRFAKKMRPVKKSPKADQTPGERREDLQAHQEENLNQLNQADQSLASDQQTLEQMLEQFRQALKNGPPHGQKSGEPSESNSPPDLAQMLKSQALQQALDMANRMRGMNQAARQSGKPRPGMTQPTTPNLQGAPPPGFALEGELGKLDLKTREALMKLQPKLREELLQSMKEQGPEGYQEFIDDYFKRLSQGKDQK